MNFFGLCDTCFSNGRAYILDVFPQDDGTYMQICSEGHEVNIFLLNNKYEILFEMALKDLNSNNLQGAVLKFASSLERFYEWFIKLSIIKKNVETKDLKNLNLYDIELETKELYDTWKLVSNQSERQLGAFYFLYLERFCKNPDKFDENQVKFRNGVIHKGKIPNYKETYKYGEKVFNYILKIVKKLDELDKNISQILLIKKYDELRSKNEKLKSSPNDLQLKKFFNEEIKEKDMLFKEAVETNKHILEAFTENSLKDINNIMKNIKMF